MRNSHPADAGIVALSAAIIMLTSCGQWPPSSSSTSGAAGSARALPTATEVFKLRSMCGELGEKMLEEDGHGPDLTTSQLSHYVPKINRCFVELTARSNTSQHFNVALYDAQTKDLLAFYGQDARGGRGGALFKTGQLGEYEAAKAYIDQMMKDDDY
jgi:hypothetical protein